MKVFVTGATGFIGQATVAELLKHNHTVTGLARSDASAEALHKTGATSLKGDLTDLASLKTGAQAADAVIHLAFIHEFGSTDDYLKSNAADRAAIAAIGEALAGTGKAFIIASGTLGFPPDQVATEDSEPIRDSPLAIRYQAADMIYEMSRKNNVRGNVIRLAPTVHGKGDQGFIHMLGNLAKKNGFATYIDDGAARWPATHRNDAARLFRLAVEKGRAGATYNAVDEEGVQMKDIMTVIGRKAGVPTASKSVEEAEALLGFFAHVVGMDNATSSEKTRAELGWQPVGLGLLEDIEQNYFVQ